MRKTILSAAALVLFSSAVMAQSTDTKGPAATDPAAMTATRGHLRFIPFRCVKHRRYARCDAHFVRPLRGSRQGGLIRRCDPAGNGCARCHCCHEAPALLTVLVPARLWQCLA